MLEETHYTNLFLISITKRIIVKKTVVLFFCISSLTFCAADERRQSPTDHYLNLTDHQVSLAEEAESKLLCPKNIHNGQRRHSSASEVAVVMKRTPLSARQDDSRGSEENTVLYAPKKVTPFMTEPLARIGLMFEYTRTDKS